jgi:hypothetical protein
VSPTGEVRHISLNLAMKPSSNSSKAIIDKLYLLPEYLKAYIIHAFTFHLSSAKPLYIIPRKKIIRGREANKAEVPYQVAIMSSYGELLCGGNLAIRNHSNNFSRTERGSVRSI